MNKLQNLFIIFLLSCGTTFAVKVAKVSGFSQRKNFLKPAENPVGSKQQKEDVNLDSPEAIERALKKMESNDINYYRSLMKIRKLNFQLFMQKLTDWVKHNNLSWINSEKFRLGQLKREINKDMRDLSKEYMQIESDSDEAKIIVKDIEEKAVELFQAQLDQKQLAIYQKKIELAALETKLDNKTKLKDVETEKIIRRFIKDYKKEPEAG